MPASILFAILNAVASHLVLLTLLGFVALGVFLFGGERDDGRMVKTDPPATAAGEAPDVPVTAEPAHDVGDQMSAASAPADTPWSREPKAPKLIGGTLPVYPRHTDGGSFGEGFRPPDRAMPSSQTGRVGYEARIQEARRAYWNGDFESAEAVYLGIVTEYPDDADAFGELGNLYEAMGERMLARDAFFAAGQRLKQRLEFDKLSHVVDWLEKKGDERVEQLRER